MSDLRSVGHRRMANARAALLAKHQAERANHDPAPGTDAGRVLAVIRHALGLPNWAIARAAKMPADQVKYACKYLKKKQLAFVHRTEYATPNREGERVQSCWFAVRGQTGLALVDTTHCRVSMGYGRSCDARLEERMDAFGRITWHCPACARRQRGLCRTCPRPITRLAVDGPAPWFCPSCLKARRDQRNRQRATTPEYKQWKADYERARVARCKAAGVPHRTDRKSA